MNTNDGEYFDGEYVDKCYAATAAYRAIEAAAMAVCEEIKKMAAAEYDRLAAAGSTPDEALAAYGAIYYPAESGLRQVADLARENWRRITKIAEAERNLATGNRGGANPPLDGGMSDG